ncbi:MAG: hypothetical protein ABGW90_00105 [Martelella sp.]
MDANFSVANPVSVERVQLLDRARPAARRMPACAAGGPAPLNCSRPATEQDDKQITVLYIFFKFIA